MLSQTAEYALRTVICLAESGQAPLPVDELAAALGLPRNYLSKTLHQLARAGVLESTRGRGGGFRLARTADGIRLLDVVGIFDRMDGERRCLLGRPVCSDRTACEAHTQWKDVSGRVADFFRETTVADLLGPASAAPRRGRRRRAPGRRRTGRGAPSAARARSPDTL